MPPRQPIQPAPTNTTAFLGYTPAGPVNEAAQVLSLADFENTFGGLAAESPVSYAVMDFFDNGGTKAWVVRIVGPTGAPNAPAASDFRGSETGGTGVWALEQATDIELLCVPGQAEPDLLEGLARYCERRRAFLIADLPQDVDTAAAAWSWAIGLHGKALKRYGAAYFPWLLMPDPLQHENPMRRSPTGAVAGLLARLDAARGVWVAPAGSGAILTGVTSVDPALVDADSAALSIVGVNPIRFVRDVGHVAWGARTLHGRQTDADDWSYLSVRRFFNYIESSILMGTQWANFEPNDEPTWSDLSQAANAFLHDLFKQGAFQGSDPCQAYFVRCDQTTTTPDDVASGVANILVGCSLLRPNEFSTTIVSVRCGCLGP
jgi:phage tail sheath protein FI